MNYSINEGYVILDENSELVEWFDTLEEAERYIEDIKQVE